MNARVSRIYRIVLISEDSIGSCEFFGSIVISTVGLFSSYILEFELENR